MVKTTDDLDLVRKYALLNDLICHKFYFWFDIDIYCLNVYLFIDCMGPCQKEMD